VTRPHGTGWLAFWTVVGACVWALVVVGAVAVVDSHQTPAWTVPPSAIRAITTPSGEQQTDPAAECPQATVCAGIASKAPDVPGARVIASVASPRLPRGTAEPMPALKLGRDPLPTSTPPGAAASHSLAELVATGTASFYDDGPGLYAALPGLWRAGRWVRVCGMAQCVSARVVTSCVCGTHVIDLSPQLWERVSGLDTAHRWQIGVTSVSITIEGVTK
jgi:hypothetical protein